VAKEENPLTLSKKEKDEVVDINIKKDKQNKKFITLFVNNIFFENVYKWLKISIKKVIKATAAQFALALTKKLSTIIIKNIGAEKANKNFSL
tara:strand:+ start:793 stop:1068 length:276 start_codon:yes stop_codon:yes gene_type:complete